jgi:competence protein ComFC
MPKITETILSLFFPRRCPFCGDTISTKQQICKLCEEKLPVVTGKICPRCGRGIDYCRCGSLRFHFERCVAPFYYEGIVRKSIINFKFYARQNSASAYAFYTADAIKREYSDEHFDFVTCVPLTGAERKKRGFNQSEIFARSLARELTLPYRDTLLKPNDVRPQRDLTAKERWRNISGAFCAAKQLNGAHVLLVDDIVTTGATLDDCARALKAAGTKRICCAVIACVKLGGEAHSL